MLVCHPNFKRPASAWRGSCRGSPDLHTRPATCWLEALSAKKTSTFPLVVKSASMARKVSTKALEVSLSGTNLCRRIKPGAHSEVRVAGCAQAACLGGYPLSSQWIPRSADLCTPFPEKLPPDPQPKACNMLDLGHPE